METRKSGRPKGSKTKSKRLIKLEKEDFLVQLELSNGCVGEALKNVGFSYSHYSALVRSDDIFKAKVEELKKIEPYYVETELFKQIKDGNIRAIIFYLSSAKGKRIGYGEEKEEQHQPVVINYVVPESTKTLMEDVRKKIEKDEEQKSNY